MRKLFSAVLFGTFTIFTSFTAIAAETININTADAATLARVLSGVGEVKAKAIVEYRKKVNGFKSINDITKVGGIGPKTLEKNRGKMRVSDKAEAKASEQPQKEETKKESSDKSKSTEDSTQ
ncbi:MAG: helix-hairpin-helix domain-containing protein [Pseudomonadota bacterium]